MTSYYDIDAANGRLAELRPLLAALRDARDEVAAGRMIIPANRVHLEYRLDPMAIGRASLTKVNANMGASPVSSGTDEEVEKLRWAERWGADTVMDLSTGGDLDACRDAILRNSSVPIGTVPIYSMIIGRSIEELTLDVILETLRHQAQHGFDKIIPETGIHPGRAGSQRDQRVHIGAVIAEGFPCADIEVPA